MNAAEMKQFGKSLLASVREMKRGKAARTTHVENPAIAKRNDDLARYKTAKNKDDGFRIPSEIVDAELRGEHPVAAWRKHRGHTLESLAKASNLSAPFIHQIETRKRVGSARTLKALAAALEVPLDVLTDEL